MNIKLITKAMHALSLLSDEDVAMVMKLRGLSEGERQMLMLVLEPQKPTAKSTERTIEHCAACDYTRRAKVHKDATVSGYHEFQPSSKKSAGKGGGGKSARASGMAEQLNKQLSGRAQSAIRPPAAATTDNIDNERCQFMSPDGGYCGNTADENVHHLNTRIDYHEYQPPAVHAATGSTGD